jgi:hypothetical protein
MKTWVMSDLNLPYSEPLPAGNGRNEAVQLAVQFEFLDNLPAVSFHATVEVVNLDARDKRDDQVEEPGGYSLQKGVLPVLLPARDQIEPFLQSFQNLGNLFRDILKVGIKGDNCLSLRCLESCSQGRRLAEVFAEPDDLRG